ncbi:VirB4 family type IV secretion/conjugal transfer ATPase [Arcobacter porcinus]|uniref:VirB4 family type IV secretion/conjugal transfer ATPase n=1 Tax=Arcobacter porcinus TaxID=1935204 RepID=UPI0008271D84|nr:hypothetical protein [Arcobacter porcinus]OCL86255.1 Type IV secretion system protein virB4 [Arcobacter porcinus]
MLLDNFKWWKPLPKQQRIEDILQIVGIYPNGEKDTLILKNGHMAIVYQVFGKDYSGLDMEQLRALHKSRNDAFKMLPENVIVTVHSRRIKEEETSFSAFSDIKIAKEINTLWNSKFDYSYKNKHYIVIVSSNASIINELSLLYSEKDKSSIRAIDTLEEASRELKSRLKEFKVKRLKDDSMISFFASYLNGKEVNQKYTNIFNHLIGGCDLTFNRDENYHTFDGNKQIYSAWVSIKSYEDNSTQKLIDELFKFQFEFSLYCQFQNLTKEKAYSMIDDKHRSARTWLRFGEDNVLEFEEAIQRVQDKEISFCFTAFTIQVKAKSKEQLEANIEDIESLVDHYGYRTIREKTNIEPLFWSLTPGLEHLMARKRYLSSENIADIVNFSTVGEGFERCSWGDNYVTKFLTSANTIYRFNFHINEKKEAIGHTLIFGGSSSGKTTLINFLMSQSLKFEELRIIAFDRLHGQEIFTKTHGGNYTNFTEDTNILNPFSLEDNKENKSFLSQMIGDIVGLENTNSIIDTGIDLIYSSLKTKQERNLTNGADAFTPMSEKDLDIKSALAPFIGNGKWSNYLNAKEDGLDFENSRLTVFNMDSLIGNPKLLGIILNYIFHRIKLMALGKDGTHKPHIMFADELPNLLESDVFAKRIKESVLENRKLDGVFIGASQTPQAVSTHNIGKTILGSFANFIFYPDSLADEKILKEDYQLNQNEINWIKNPGDGREVLLKRNFGDRESIILNVNLESLGTYLNCFNSSSTQVQRIRALEKTNKNWIKELLEC